MAEFSVADELLKLKNLLDSGVLTQEEFDNQKKRILNNDIETPQPIEFNPNSLYRITINSIPGESRDDVIRFVCMSRALSYEDGSRFIGTLPCLLRTGITAAQCERYKAKLENLGCGITVKEDLVSMEQQKGQERREQQAKQAALPRCPKCGSTNISTGARGVNWKWGLIGASKTVNRCAKCGHTWAPKN